MYDKSFRRIWGCGVKDSVTQKCREIKVSRDQDFGLRMLAYERELWKR